MHWKAGLKLKSMIVEIDIISWQKHGWKIHRKSNIKLMKAMTLKNENVIPKPVIFYIIRVSLFKCCKQKIFFYSILDIWNERFIASENMHKWMYFLNWKIKHVIFSNLNETYLFQIFYCLLDLYFFWETCSKFYCYVFYYLMFILTGVELSFIYGKNQLESNIYLCDTKSKYMQNIININF